MSMNTLPPEIMLMILHPSNFMRPVIYPIIPQRSTTKEYSKLRLVNKEFSAYITPHLFKNITIRSRECGLKRLEHITESAEIQTWVKRYSYVLDLNNPLERSTPSMFFKNISVYVLRIDIGLQETSMKIIFVSWLILNMPRNLGQSTPELIPKWLKSRVGLTSANLIFQTIFMTYMSNLCPRYQF